MNKSNNNLENVELEIITSKNTALDVVNNLLKREDNLNNIEKKSKELEENSLIFYKKSKKLKRKFCCNKYKIKFLCILISLFVLYFILSLNCGFDLNKCIN